MIHTQKTRTSASSSHAVNPSTAYTPNRSLVNRSDGWAIAASVAQVGTVLVATFAYFFTVVPVFQKERLAEEVASLQKEQAKSSESLLAAQKDLEDKQIELGKVNDDLTQAKNELGPVRQALFDYELSYRLDVAHAPFGKNGAELFPMKNKTVDLAEALTYGWGQPPMDQIMDVLAQAEHGGLTMPVTFKELQELIFDVRQKVSQKRDAFTCGRPNFEKWSASYFHEFALANAGAKELVSRRVQEELSASKPEERPSAFGVNFASALAEQAFLAAAGNHISAKFAKQWDAARLPCQLMVSSALRIIKGEKVPGTELVSLDPPTEFDPLETVK